MINDQSDSDFAPTSLMSYAPSQTRKPSTRKSKTRFESIDINTDNETQDFELTPYQGQKEHFLVMLFIYTFITLHYILLYKI